MQRVDDLMQMFLRATDHAEGHRLLEQIIGEHARPLLTQIIRAKLRLTSNSSDRNRALQDSDDVVAEVVLQLVKRLSEVKSDPEKKPPTDFTSYVAVAAHNAFKNYLRRKHPERWRLKDKLRYVLLYQDGLLLWEDFRGRWVCGLAIWRDLMMPPCSAERFRELSEDRAEHMGELQRRDQSLTRLVAAIFDLASCPIELNDLVTIVAGVLSVTGGRSTIGEEPEWDVDALKEVPDNQPSIVTRLEQRFYLERLWAEIRLLPLTQRRALLLNLRDRNGSDMTALIAHTGVATVYQIAEVLELTTEEFLHLSRELPMEDAILARHLGLTRQQVINLRNSARRRLARRMKNVEECRSKHDSATFSGPTVK